LGAITAAMALKLGELSEALLQAHNAYDINNATDDQLDRLCALLNIYRRTATYSTVTLSMIATSAITVPAGSIAKDTLGQRWILQEDVLFVFAGLGLWGGSGVAKAETIGAVSAAASTISIIDTPVSGWGTVSNILPATLGQTDESDVQLRRRRAASLRQGVAGTLTGILAAVAGLSFVEAATVLENSTALPATVDTLLMPPHSFGVVVAPSVLTAAQQVELTAAIALASPAGIYSYGSETGDYAYSDDVSVTYRWSYSSAVTVDVVSAITVDADYDAAEVQADVEAAITQYFEDLDMGQDVRVLRVLGVIDDVVGTLTATLTLNGLAADIPLSAVELATLGTLTVTT
jgi:uncharacterized phage protein gp47/JayE